ncbi:SURF1 family protein [Ideonella azotifigens]|nr:SURF1 family protein [Ideonella azotifigens]MCD2339603.1 SURF1 family protein [Ideonella azotifigens]
MAMTAGQRRGLVLLAALLGMALMARMGLWQLDRAKQKLALQAEINEHGQLPALGNDSLARTQLQADEQAYRPITLTGHWVPGATVFLDNRQMQGRPGFFMLTPLRLATGDAVLVQRGWAPRDQRDRTRLPQVPTPDGEVRVTGRVAPWPSRLTQLGEDAPGPIRQNLDREAFAAQQGLSLRPLSVQALAPMALGGVPQDDGLLRDWPQPAVDVAKHYGYAAQWFVFCAMIAGLYVWFQLIRPRRARA